MKEAVAPTRPGNFEPNEAISVHWRRLRTPGNGCSSSFEDRNCGAIASASRMACKIFGQMPRQPLIEIDQMLELEIKRARVALIRHKHIEHGQRLKRGVVPRAVGHGTVGHFKQALQQRPFLFTERAADLRKLPAQIDGALQAPADAEEQPSQAARGVFALHSGKCGEQFQAKIQDRGILVELSGTLLRDRSRSWPMRIIMSADNRSRTPPPTRATSDRVKARLSVRLTSVIRETSSRSNCSKVGRLFLALGNLLCRDLRATVEPDQAAEFCGFGAAHASDH